jgi:hypothetical protein
MDSGYREQEMQHASTVLGAVFLRGFSDIKSLKASIRVSGYFKSGKWPQFIMDILNVAFIFIVFNQIPFSSATLAVYLH